MGSRTRIKNNNAVWGDGKGGISGNGYDRAVGGRLGTSCRRPQGFHYCVGVLHVLYMRFTLQQTPVGEDLRQKQTQHCCWRVYSKRIRGSISASATKLRLLLVVGSRRSGSWVFSFYIFSFLWYASFMRQLLPRKSCFTFACVASGARTAKQQPACPRPTMKEHSPRGKGGVYRNNSNISITVVVAKTNASQRPPTAVRAPAIVKTSVSFSGAGSTARIRRVWVAA